MRSNVNFGDRKLVPEIECQFLRSKVNSRADEAKVRERTLPDLFSEQVASPYNEIPEIENSIPETRNSALETRYPKPETQNPEPETRNSIPGTRYPKPEIQNPEPQTQNSKLDTRCGTKITIKNRIRICISRKYLFMLIIMYCLISKFQGMKDAPVLPDFPRVHRDIQGKAPHTSLTSIVHPPPSTRRLLL